MLVAGIAFAVQHHGRRDERRAVLARTVRARVHEAHVRLVRIHRGAQERRRRVHAVLPAHVEVGVAHLVDHLRVEVHHLVELVDPRLPDRQRRLRRHA